MNNFHIYEEVGRGKYSVVYKVINIHILTYLHYTIINNILIIINKGKKEEDNRLCSSEIS
jgi:hypothetical protein